MLTGIDHLVILVSDLEKAIQNYTQLGFTVVPGGRHPIGTHNALIAFADGTYLELLAFYQPNPESRWWVKLQQGGGLIDFCMQTDDLRAEIAAFREAGIQMSDPSPLSRVRPDGYQLRWSLSIPQGRDEGVVPFLIEDETPRAERVPRETNHANRVTGIGTVTFVVDDLAAIHRGYAGILQNCASFLRDEEPVRDYASFLRDEGQRITREDLDAVGVRFTIGPHGFDFVVPQGPASPLNNWRRDCGPSPYAVTLRTASGKGGLLDETKTLGARLLLV